MTGVLTADRPPAPAAPPRYTVALARDEDEVRAAQRLRHDVFAGEMGALLASPQPGHALPATVALVARALREGAAVAAFPEGSTWCGRAHGRFRRAVFQAALDAGVPVRPVRIRYRTGARTPSTVPAFVGEDVLLASLWRVVSARGLTAEVEVCPAVPPGRHPDRRSLADAAQSAYAAAGTGDHGHQGKAPSKSMCPL
ncbi:1-acyl-sn-glycerol-3-phosphate acyltransferase [Streptomyces flaveolus]|uniref:lysophospholipid acyltransferase family protein n=1 Tax=Streptomyces flaveolus TaxID=67297 RepID=UPI00340F6E6A